MEIFHFGAEILLINISRVDIFILFRMIKTIKIQHPLYWMKYDVELMNLKEIFPSLVAPKAHAGLAHVFSLEKSILLQSERCGNFSSNSSTLCILEFCISVKKDVTGVYTNMKVSTITNEWNQFFKKLNDSKICETKAWKLFKPNFIWINRLHYVTRNLIMEAAEQHQSSFD